jgi:hypothetical protein
VQDGSFPGHRVSLDFITPERYRDATTMPTRRVFLLSPARCDGKRAQILMRDAAAFPLARQLRTPKGATLGEVFSFLSGLYFRGKLAYALRFAVDAAELPGAWIITTNRGLVAPHTLVTVDDLRQFGCTDIHEDDAAYHKPLRRDAKKLAARIGDDAEVVLLGSVATGKYVNVLLEVFGERLRFPVEFAGRGDMSRGGLMLRCVDSGKELTYVSLTGSTARRGKRPPKLEHRQAKVSS